MQIERLDSGAEDFAVRLRALCAPAADGVPADGASAVRSRTVRRAVSRIRRAVLRDGDAALLKFTAQFDRHSADSVAALEVGAAQLQKALAELPAQLRADLQTAAQRIRDYHRRQLSEGWEFTDEHGNRMGERVRAVRRAVVYAPGGTAAYPSSVLMGVIPAQLAGVADVILTTPAPGGAVSAVTLAAAAIAGAHRVFLLGGAQAVFAFAFGTATLPRADVIVGPGNAYVTEAKRQVFGAVGLDSLAGPSEVLIISDATTPPAWVAADLLAQAEHDADARCILVSADKAHLDAVETEVQKQIATAARAEIICDALTNNGAFILARDGDDAIRIADEIAAEHIQVMTADAEADAEKICNSGGVFVGRHSCVALGDYVAGANHILPTLGGARFASPLGTQHFVRRSGMLCATAAGARALAGTTARLATAEGLPAHAASVQLRAGDGDDGDDIGDTKK